MSQLAQTEQRNIESFSLNSGDIITLESLSHDKV